MTITYPLALPATPKAKRVTLRMMDVVAMSRSPFTGQSQVYAHAGQWWEADVSLPSMIRASAEPWLAFLASLRGMYGTFLMGSTTGAAPRGIATGAPAVAGAGQSGMTLMTDGWTTGQTGILKAGDYIQVGTELHKVLADANSDGGGLATLDIWPALRASPADNATIVVNNAVGLFRLAANARPWDESEGPIYDIAFSCVEAF